MNSHRGFRSGETVTLILDDRSETTATVIRPYKGYVEVETTGKDGRSMKLFVLPQSLRKPDKETKHADDRNQS